VSGRERVLACIACAVAILVGYYLLVLDPILKERGAVEVGIAKAEAQLEAGGAALVGGSDVALEYSDLRSRVAYDPGRAPAAHQTRMIRALTVACNQAGAVLENAAPMDVEEKDGLARHPVQVHVKGSLESVVMLLEGLARARPAMSIDRFSIDYDERSELFDAQLLLAAYTPAGSAPTSAEAPQRGRG
jgi:hypothetical protein